jgi:predicted ATP-dependent endonuclease of OLD family
MKLTKTQVQKFRSIEHCDVSLSDVTAIVGENNAGKSARA